MTSSTNSLARRTFLGGNYLTPSGLAVEHLFKMAATDAEFWASLETNFFGIACTLEAKTSVRNLTQYKLFIGDNEKISFLEWPSPLKWVHFLNLTFFVSWKCQQLFSSTFISAGCEKVNPKLSISQIYLGLKIIMYALRFFEVDLLITDREDTSFARVL